MLEKFKQIDKSEPLRAITLTTDIGIVYDVKLTDAATLNSVMHHFEALGKSVMVLGYYSEKDLGELIPDYKMDYFCKKDLNFWTIPKHQNILRFVNKEFDMLINLDTEGSLPLQAVSAFSKAKTRVGKHIDAFAFAHDFMVESSAGTSAELFTEIKKFLK